MRYILFFAITFSSIVACEKNKGVAPHNEEGNNDVVGNCVNDSCYTCNLDEPSQVIYDKLMKAYRDSCTSCLEVMLADWNNAFVPDTHFANSLKDVFDVYKEIYSPWDLSRVRGSDGYNTYQGVSFYVIQNTIRYDYNFRTSGGQYYTISPFHPAVACDAHKTLYLNKDYESAINCFLGSDYVPARQLISVTPYLPNGESDLRYNFLRNYLLFYRGHWGNYWHIETHPEVEIISFNVSKDSAQVHFRLGYEGGEVILGKEGDQWKIVDRKMTWVE